MSAASYKRPLMTNEWASSLRSVRIGLGSMSPRFAIRQNQTRRLCESNLLLLFCKISRSSLRKTVLFVSALMAFHVSAYNLCNDRDRLQQRLSGVPPIIIDGLLNRFTEKLRGSSEWEMLVISNEGVLNNPAVRTDPATLLKTTSSCSRTCLLYASVLTTMLATRSFWRLIWRNLLIGMGWILFIWRRFDDLSFWQSQSIF